MVEHNSNVVVANRHNNTSQKTELVEESGSYLENDESGSGSTSLASVESSANISHPNASLSFYMQSYFAQMLVTEITLPNITVQPFLTLTKTAQRSTSQLIYSVKQTSSTSSASTTFPLVSHQTHAVRSLKPTTKSILSSELSSETIFVPMTGFANNISTPAKSDANLHRHTTPSSNDELDSIKSPVISFIVERCGLTKC